MFCSKRARQECGFGLGWSRIVLDLLERGRGLGESGG
jgi:hypothetical protein